MTPAQPAPLDDAGAMAVLDRLREAERDPYGAVRDPQARASIAAEAADTIEALIARATRAEAELAAVIKAADYFARNFTGKNSDKLRAAIADAARGEGG